MAITRKPLSSYRIGDTGDHEGLPGSMAVPSSTGCSATIEVTGGLLGSRRERRFLNAASPRYSRAVPVLLHELRPQRAA